MEPNARPQKLQRVLGASKFGPSGKQKMSFVLLKCGTDEYTKHWVTEMVLLLHALEKGCEK